MNRVVIQEGYTLPFAGLKKRRAKKSGGLKRQQSKMKSCAKQWKRVRAGKSVSYVRFMKSCLKK